jgi:hypothetical protein
MKIKMKVRKVSIGVDEDFYRKLEEEKRRWMKREGLERLSTRAFTKVLARKNCFGVKNVKKQKRRRK